MSEMDISTPEGRKAAYDQFAAIFYSMAASKERHVAEYPDCPGAPMCVGPDAMEMLNSNLVLTPEYGTGVLLAAVGEMVFAKQRHAVGMTQLAEMGRRLEVQREMTADVTKALDETQRELAGAVAASAELTRELEAKDQELANVLAELTVWEESADSLAPAALPDPE